MGEVEVARFEEDRRGVMDLLRLWKGVEKCSGGLRNAPIPQRWEFAKFG